MSQTSSVSADSYLEAASRAMSKLQDLHSMPDSSWKKALTQKKSGCVVYITKEKSYVSQGRSEKKGFYAPVFKGVLDISGFAPTAVFAVMGTRKLWDDWSVAVQSCSFVTVLITWRDSQVQGGLARREPLRRLVAHLHVRFLLCPESPKLQSDAQVFAGA